MSLINWTGNLELQQLGFIMYTLNERPRNHAVIFCGVRGQNRESPFFFFTLIYWIHRRVVPLIIYYIQYLNHSLVSEIENFKLHTNRIKLISILVLNIIF